jgi:hypothetical protein
MAPKSISVAPDLIRGPVAAKCVGEGLGPVPDPVRDDVALGRDDGKDAGSRLMGRDDGSGMRMQRALHL